MNDLTSGVNDERGQPGVPLAQHATARDRSFLGGTRHMESVRELNAGYTSAFASVLQPTRVRGLAARTEVGSFVGATGGRLVAGAMADNAFVELIVSSFKSFREVGGFQRALASIPEAGSIRVHHLHQGKLQVSVQCLSAGTLLRSLATVYDRSFKVVAREPHRVELALVDSDSLAAGPA
jgi:hypothetical protein